MKVFSRRKLIWIALCCVCLAAMAVSGIKLCQILTEYHEAETTYEEVTESAIIEPPEVSSTDAVVLPEYTAPFTVDFETLRQTNPDVVGWIYCEDTVINYPVMQGEDNSHYMVHLFDGRYNLSGSIMLDCRSRADMTDEHIIIYGHNMKNRTMFTVLRHYASQKFYDEHPLMWIFTPDETFAVEIIAGYLTSARTEEEFDLTLSGEALTEHVADAIERSDFVSGIDPSEVRQLVTLVTCSYEYSDARYILLGNLVPLSGRDYREPAPDSDGPGAPQIEDEELESRR